MSVVFFRNELEGVANFWRIFRRDGAALAFTSHDRDLWFDGMLHRAAPGMVPSAIRRTADLSADSAEVEGVLSHDAITSHDLAAGRYDDGAIIIGAVNWETLESAALYHGSLGGIAEDGESFRAELRSSKALLGHDYIPRTSPTCRAKFCGPGCTLAAVRFTLDATIVSLDLEENAVTLDIGNPSDFIFGRLRWLNGPQTGISSIILANGPAGLVLDTPLPDTAVIGQTVELREGCDRRLATCTTRFANAVNFQGEPFLPGNDLLARYPVTA